MPLWPSFAFKHHHSSSVFMDGVILSENKSGVFSVPMKWLRKILYGRTFRRFGQKFRCCCFLRTALSWQLLLLLCRFSPAALQHIPLQNEISWQRPDFSVLHCNHCCSLAGLYGSSIYPDPENAAGRYAFVPDSDAGIYGVWSILNETVLPVGTE